MKEHTLKLHHARIRAHEKGFTLVELAIVLVIIGLIIGGVLVGQDLIKAAEIRAQISQIESYNSAVNTFRTRFNGLPGDIRNATSFFAAATWPDVRNGDGDRQLEIATAGVTAGLVAASGAGVVYNVIDNAAATDHVGEVLQFWLHLSAAELVGGSFNGTGGNASAQLGTVGFSFPTTKLDRNGVGVFGSGGRNFYQLGVISGTTYTVNPSLLAEEAFNLDTKIDDGRPGTGSVIARAANASPKANVTPGATDFNFVGGTNTAACIQEAAFSTAAEIRAATYATTNQNLACSIRLRMN